MTTQPGPQGPIEPRADLRRAARHLREYHVALLAEGFTEQQALAILGYTLAAGQGRGGR